jgi:GMP synthase (glutamine-hydrolysing)
MTRVAVVDNGGQFTHLEQRALRDAGVETDIIDNTTPPEAVDADGIVLSGGPHEADPDRGSRYLDLGVPVLGICLGMQDLAAARGGTVGPGDYGGYADVTVHIDEPEDRLVGSLAPDTRVWASHADEVKQVPDGFVRTAHSDVCAVEAMSHESEDWFGVQWHPEVAHTEEGDEVFENFLAVCKA